MQQPSALGPADIPQLLQVLQGSLSPAPPTQKAAESTLQTLEAQPGYCSCLVEIVSTKSIDHSLRWLAATQIKNAIVRHWRPRGTFPGAVSDEEKAHLRQQLIRLVEQDDNQIAAQVAVMFAKVARSDFPTAWPSLFTDLLQLLANPQCTSLGMRRVYHILHTVLKELASKRLVADQRVFAQVSSMLLQPLWQQWTSDTATLATQLLTALDACLHTHAPQPPRPPPTNDPLLLTLERWLFVLKALRRVVLFGGVSDAKTMQPNEAVLQVAPDMQRCTIGLLTMRLTAARQQQQQQPQHPPPRLLALLDRGLCKLARTLTDLVNTHPWSCYACGMVAAHMEATVGYLTSHDASVLGTNILQRYTVQCLNFVYAVNTCAAYQVKASEKTSNTAVQHGPLAVQQWLGEFWNTQRLGALLETLVVCFLPLTPRELSEWQHNPEELFHELEGAPADSDRLRPAAERLWLYAARHHTPAVTTLLATQLPAMLQAAPPGTGGALPPGAPALVRKAAVYAAVGLASSELYEHLGNFQELLHGALVPDMGCVDAAARPVQRQAIKLVAQWCAKLQSQDRPQLYMLLIQAMQPGQQRDELVALTAVNTLHVLIDDWGFEEQQLIPLVGHLFQAAADLLASVNELDSQTQIFSLVNLVVDRLGAEITPHAQGLLSLLPAVWGAAEGQGLLRLQVLVAMTRLINALGMGSPAAYPVLLPMLQYALSLHEGGDVVLLEDGLSLWLVSLRNAPGVEGSGGLLGLLPKLVVIVGQSTEYLPGCCAVLRSCLYLGGGQLVAQSGAQMASMCVDLIGNINERGMTLLLPVLAHAVQACPSEQTAHALLPAFQKLLMCMMGGKEGDVAVTAGITALARLLLAFPTLFVGLFDATAATMQTIGTDGATPPGHALLVSYVDFWMDRFDSIGSAHARKLAALAACQLLTLPVPALLQRLDVLLPTISSVVVEASQAAEVAGAYGLDLTSDAHQFDMEDVNADSAVVLSAEAEGEAQRRAAVSAHDPVSTLQVSSFLRSCLDVGAGRHGPTLQQAVSRIDPVLLQGLQLA